MISRLKHIDWDFAGDSSASALSSVHWHPCRFVSQIPASLIGVLTKPGSLILDPYCGSGTTLVEAQRLGRRALGIDINPIATLVSRSKLFPTSAMIVERSVTRLTNTILGHRIEIGRNEAHNSTPKTVQAKKWYHPQTARELAYLWHLVRNSSSPLKALFQAAFSSILLGVCNETRNWGYVCDNTAPKGQRRVDAIDAFLRALQTYLLAYKQRDLFLAKGLRHPLPKAKVVPGDAQEELSKLESSSVDLIITSPPYFGVCDYIKAQRLSFEWFGFDIEPIRLRETGARSKRHRGTALPDYLRELRNVIGEGRRVLRSDGAIALIFGESTSRKSVLPDIRQILADAEFDIVIEQPRRISMQRRQNPSLTQELVIVARRCG